MIAGVDGCKGGWIAVLAPLGGLALARAVVAPAFAGLLTHAAIIAVDMPIGLPEHSGRGREAEIALRPLLGARRSSLFPIPSRAAVYEPDYASARKLALSTSDPPKSIARQAFNIFPKIREIDALLRADAAAAARVFECHPEGCFRMMAGAPPAWPKKHAAGAAERRALLLAAGFAPALLDARPPRGAALDDLLDACAAAWTAQRLARGVACCWPQAPARDAHGLSMAIWA